MRSETVESRHDYEVEAALRDSMRREPRSAEGYIRLARHLSRAGRQEEALTVLRDGLARASETAPIEHDLGLVLACSGDLEDAARHLERAVELAPGHAGYLRSLGLVRGASGQTDVSVSALREASDLAGDAAAPEWEALIRLGERTLCEEGKAPPRRPPRSSRRESFIEAAVARQPELAEALATGDGEDPAAPVETLRAARRALLRLLRDHPAYADLHYRFSLIEEQLGKVDRAIASAEKALTINPRYAEAALLAVRLYERQGRPERAAEHCRRVTELRPRWPDVHVRLGELLRVQGRADEATEAYRRALDLDGSCAKAREGLVAVGAEVPDAPAEGEDA